MNKHVSSHSASPSKDLADGTQAPALIERGQSVIIPEERLLIVSAKTKSSLTQSIENIQATVANNPTQLGNIAYTLINGRDQQAECAALISSETGDSTSGPSWRVFKQRRAETRPSLVYMFPGQGSQVIGMGRELYQQHSIFREFVSECERHLSSFMDVRLTDFFVPDEHADLVKLSEQLKQTSIAQPALFVIESGLAKLLISKGIQPNFLIGHSIGEFAAAYISGIFTLENALKLVSTRGKLMQSMPAGAMLAVKADPDELSSFCTKGINLASHNAPGMSVLAGPIEQITALGKELNKLGFETRGLHTSHAFHSEMMAPILSEFASEVLKAQPKAPQIPIISTMTGLELSDEEASSPEYWSQQLRNPVRYADAVAHLCDDENRVFVELGPGCTLTTFTAAVAANHTRPRKLIDTLGHPKLELSALDGYLSCLGQLWLQGVDFDWGQLLPANHYKLIRLPTYPFDRKRYFIEPPSSGADELGSPQMSSLAVPVEPACEDLVSKPNQKVYELLTQRLGSDVNEDNQDCSFIELGFDSLALSQLSSKIQQEFSLKIAVKKFYEELNTPYQLAGFIGNNAPASSANEVPKVKAEAAIAQKSARLTTTLEERLIRIEEKIDLLLKHNVNVDNSPSFTFAKNALSQQQQEIWAAVKLGGDEANVAYNECRRFEFDGVVDKDKLFEALHALIDRHEGLKLLFSEDGGEYYIDKSAAFSIEERDLSDLIDSEKQLHQDQLIQSLVSTPLNLEKGPLFYGYFVLLSHDKSALIMCAHHIIVDGSSWELLIRELANTYTSKVTNTALGLPDATPVSTFIERRQHYSQSPEAANDLAFWTAHLAGQSEDVSLPADNARSLERTLSSSRLDQVLDKNLTETLQPTAAKLGCSIQTLLLATFSILINNLTRQTDFIIGIPTSGQASEGLDGCVGHCVNVLPLRNLYNNEQSIAEYAKTLHGTLLDAMEHQKVSLYDIVNAVKRPRDSSRPTLVQVAFGMGRSSRHPHFEGVDVEVTVPPRVSENFELYVYATTISKTQIEISWSYNKDLFLESTIQCWQRCFETLLNDIITSPNEKQVKHVGVLDSADQKFLLGIAQGESIPKDQYLSISLQIQRSAEAFPDKIAIDDFEKSYTYRELDISANQFAHFLLHKPTIESRLVAVCLDRGFSLMSTLLGIWRSGYGYIPVDPTYPATRIEMIVEDANYPLIITSKKYTDLFPASTEVLYIEDIADATSSFETVAPQAEASDESCAYVIFTSGSTGRPKGVQIPQRAVENFICAMSKAPGLNQTDTLLAITTIAFDISVLELFLPLVVGATVVIATAEQVRDAKALQGLVDTKGVTVMQATPATWQMMFEGGWVGQKGMKVLCGGESLPKPLASKLIETCGELWNVYGPTETTVWSSCKKITDSTDLSIGRPIDNTTMYVLDEQLRLTPPGAPGELWIGGRGVADGYLGRSDLTAERFITSPFGLNDRIYKTGDLARVRADGNFECLGRADFQIKIRGFRIELGEIEARLMSHPTILHAVVTPLIVKDRAVDLVAYYRLNDAGSSGLPTSELKNYLSLHLPKYMLPSHYVELSAFPMTPNGKIDRKRLPPPSMKSVNSVPNKSTEDCSDLEHAMIYSWKKILDVQDISIDDEYTSLGGTSINAARLIQEMYINTGLRFNVAQLFNEGTIRALLDSDRSAINRSTSIVKLNQGTGTVSTYCLLGLFLYKEVAKYFTNPVYGVFAERELAMTSGEQAHQNESSIKQLAEAYVQAILRHQEQNPSQSIALIGASFGGLIALEVGQKLQEAGIRVHNVVLLDTHLPFTKQLSIRQLALDVKSNVCSLNLCNLVLKKIKDIKITSIRRSDNASAARSKNETLVNLTAYFDCSPDRFNLDVILIKAQHSSRGFGKSALRDYGFSKINTGPVRVLNIASSHLGMLAEPDAEKLHKLINS